MVTSSKQTKTYKTYFTYSAHVSEKSRKAIKDAVIELRDRAKKNKQLFDDLHVNVCYSSKDLVGDTQMDYHVREDKNFDKKILGITQNPFMNDGVKEIVIRSGNPSLWGILESSFDESELRQTVFHELGHRFDYDLTRNSEAENLLKELNLKVSHDWSDVSLLKLILDKIDSSSLSDTKEFKAAWQSDVSELAKNPDTLYYLDYYSPFKESLINIFDGVDENEVKQAKKERKEIFAQLFAYSVGAGSNDKRADFIKKAYSKTYEVVKSFVKKYLGIESTK